MTRLRDVVYIVVYEFIYVKIEFSNYTGQHHTGAKKRSDRTYMYINLYYKTFGVFDHDCKYYGLLLGFCFTYDLYCLFNGY